jgi:hypothetical protein
MKLEDCLKAYYEFSEKASNSSRQLAFAAIAVIWVFRNPDGSNQILPGKLITAAFFVVFSLGFDLFQYIAGSLIWWIFHRGKEKQGLKADDEIKASIWLSAPIHLFFWLKIISLILGYIFILIFLWGRF